jgi:hypothetical protein
MTGLFTRIDVYLLLDASQAAATSAKTKTQVAPLTLTTRTYRAHALDRFPEGPEALR